MFNKNRSSAVVVAVVAVKPLHGSWRRQKFCKMWSCCRKIMVYSECFFVNETVRVALCVCVASRYATPTHHQALHIEQ